ncbi:MAG: NADH-quinone oxidoreductase subunit J [Chloroflexota bacterium]|nr:NADH-quinone oxidoreductase subunit J [Chloroflexota bacterium]MDQ5866034.1 NADH-quinone oxidoreductase subunit J [Chloroflexota bacterium]
MQVFGIDIPLTLGQMVFFPVAGLAVLASVMMITRRDAVHSALWLVVTFFQLAIMYVMLGAEFLAVLQVLVYTGAILVLFLFVVMLLNLREGPKLGGVHTAQLIAAWPVGIILALELSAVILFSRVPSEAHIGDVIGNQTIIWSAEQVLAVGGNVQALGQTLYTQFLFPFEVASLILLMAVLGAIVLARKEEPLEVEEVIPSVGISVGRRSVSNSPQGDQVEKKLLPALGRGHITDIYNDDIEYPLVQQPSAEGEGTTAGVEMEPTDPDQPRK